MISSNELDQFSFYIDQNKVGNSCNHKSLLTSEANEILTYFDDLIYQVIQELSIYLRLQYPNVFFLNSYRASTEVDLKVTLADIMYHCYPILYGMQSSVENIYQKTLLKYFNAKLNGDEEKEQIRLYLLTRVFQQFAVSKRINNTVFAQLKKLVIDKSNSNFLVRREIQNFCSSLRTTFGDYQAMLSDSRNRSKIAGIICRLDGFASFAERKLIDLLN